MLTKIRNIIIAALFILAYMLAGTSDFLNRLH